MSGDLFQKGRPVSVARLIRFNFPVDWAGPESVESGGTGGEIKDLKVGDFIAVEPRITQYTRVYIARVDRPFHGQDLVEVTLFHVPTQGRYGPWQRRVWEVWLDGGRPRSEVLTASEVLCKVTLVNGALTQTSLEELVMLGCAVGTQPGRDATLPPRSSVS